MSSVTTERFARQITAAAGCPERNAAEKSSGNRSTSGVMVNKLGIDQKQYGDSTGLLDV